MFAYALGQNRDNGARFVAALRLPALRKQMTLHLLPLAFPTFEG